MVFVQLEVINWFIHGVRFLLLKRDKTEIVHFVLITLIWPSSLQKEFPDQRLIH